jgi:hypothetical protein
MGNAALDVDSLFVQLLQDFVVLHLRVHLDFEGVDLEQLSTLFLILLAFFVLKNLRVGRGEQEIHLPCTTSSVP